MKAAGIVLFIIASIAMLPTVLAVMTLAQRDKRWPSFFLIVELIGRWWKIPSERKDGWVSTAAVGYQVAIVAFVSGVVFLHASD